MELVIVTFYALPLLSALVVLFAGPRRVMFYSPAFLFLLYHTVFSAGSSVMVYLETGNLRPIWVPSLFAVAFCLGALPAASAVRLFGGSAIKNVMQQRLTVSDVHFLRSIVVVSVIALVLYYLVSGVVPLFTLFDGSSMGMHEARRAITYAHREAQVSYFGQGYLKALFSIFLPIAVMALALNHKLTHFGWGKYRLYMAMTVVAQALSGQIWPAMLCAVLFIFAVLCFQGVHEGRAGNVYRVAVKLLMLFMALILAFFAFRWLQYIGGRTFSSGFAESAISRLLFVRHAWLYVLFPETYGFRWGGTWVNDVLGFLPGAREMFAYEVHYIVNGGAWGFTMYPSIFASIYVNFGPYIGAMVALLLGFVIQVSYIAIISRAHNAFNFSLAIYFSVYQMYSAKADITSILVPYLIIVALLIARRVFGFGYGAVAAIK